MTNKTSNRWSLFKIAIIALLLPFTHSFSQETSDTEKMKLLTKAIEARDKGDLKKARSILADINEASPDDANITNQLQAVDKEIDNKTKEANKYNDLLIGATAKQAEAINLTIEHMNIAEAARISKDFKTTYQELAIAQKIITPFESIGTEALTKGLIQIRSNALFDQAVDASKDKNSESDSLSLIEQYKEEFGSDGRIISFHKHLTRDMSDYLYSKIQEANAARDYPKAFDLLESYASLYGVDSRVEKLSSLVKYNSTNPFRQDISKMNGDFVENNKSVQKSLLKGRSLYLAGDLIGAKNAFSQIDRIDPGNIEANLFLKQISERQEARNYVGRLRTRREMLDEVNSAWQRPRVIDQGDAGDGATVATERPLLKKLKDIRIPRAFFSGLQLSKVIETLSELSGEYDFNEPNETLKGVNIVLLDPQGTDPRVNINLKNLSLDKILHFVTQQVNFSYEVNDDAVVVQPGEAGGGGPSLDTEFFPITRAAVIRLTGGGGGGGGGDDFGGDPFADDGGGGSGGISDEEGLIKSFFERAGVNFTDTPGSSMAYEGTELIITQSTRNLERCRIILRRFNETKQVEVEAKFIEVSQRKLDEVSFNWGELTNTNGTPVRERGALYSHEDGSIMGLNTRGRSIEGAFSGISSNSAIRVIGTSDISIPTAPPPLPTGADLALGVSPSVQLRGILKNFEFNMFLQAISREASSDLLTAPKITVLAGSQASINIGQEFIYPTSYEAPEDPEVGDGTAKVGGPKPEDFETKLVGVELFVTPTVEEKDTITLQLTPTVTEFEGFVEYGSPSVAIAGNTTVTVPSGYFQPIFSVRKVDTTVTVFDGATVVLGGLTRSEIKTVNDSVPVLGDLPLIGRLFRNVAETSEKRNLLIFVTANLISPAGSPSTQSIGTIAPNSMFQNPIIVSPQGEVRRKPID